VRLEIYPGLDYYGTEDIGDPNQPGYTKADLVAWGQYSSTLYMYVEEGRPPRQIAYDEIHYLPNGKIIVEATPYRHEHCHSSFNHLFFTPITD